MVDLNTLVETTNNYLSQQTSRQRKISPLNAAKSVVKYQDPKELAVMIINAPKVWILDPREYIKVSESGDEPRIRSYAALLIVAKLYEDAMKEETP